MAESPQNYPQTFLAALPRLLEDEGGYVNNPADPGGETKFGISKRSYPNLDIKSLTRDQAIAIYFADYWQKFSLSDLTPRIAAKVFDIGVDIYMPPAIVCLQRACRACGQPLDETGVITGFTKNVVETLTAQNERALMAALRSELAAHYRLVAQHQGRGQVFIKGWLNRAYS